jgi:hypothetical protein
MGRGSGVELQANAATVTRGRRVATNDFLRQLPLALDTYDDETRADIVAAVSDVIAMTPSGAFEAASSFSSNQQVNLQGVIGVCGKPRAGKDVIADYLTATYQGVARFAFSDTIKMEANEFLSQISDAADGRDVQYHHITDANKSIPEYRHLLQAWGISRLAEDPHHWTKAVKRSVLRAQAEGARLVVVTGARMPTDVDVIHEVGGRVFRAIRPGNDYVAEHAVEAGLDGVPDSEFVDVFNAVEGSLAAFHENIEAVLRGQPQPHLP